MNPTITTLVHTVPKVVELFFGPPNYAAHHVALLMRTVKKCKPIVHLLNSACSEGFVKRDVVVRARTSEFTFAIDDVLCSLEASRNG